MIAALAQQGAGMARKPGITDVLLPVGLMIVAVVILAIVVVNVRRRILGRESALNHPASLMEDLRRMRDSGELSQEEFEASRARVTAAITGRPVAASVVAPRTRPSDDMGPIRRAKPGFDLTGAPLPTRRDDGPPSPGGGLSQTPPSSPSPTPPPPASGA